MTAPNLALGLRLLLEAYEQAPGYTRPGRGIARARQVEAASAAGDWIKRDAGRAAAILPTSTPSRDAAPMPPKRTTGTNAPGGIWNATPNTARTRPVVKFTLSRPVVEAIGELAGGVGAKSGYVERLIREDAIKRGKPIPEE